MIRIPITDSDLRLYCVHNIANEYATHDHAVESLYMLTVELCDDCLHMYDIALG
jgi:hypothetical protein